MMRILSLCAAMISPFLFPFPLTLMLMALAGYFFAPAPLLVGILTDILYYVPDASPLPLGFLAGAGIALSAYAVRQFVKTRIMH